MAQIPGLHYISGDVLICRLKLQELQILQNSLMYLIIINYALYAFFLLISKSFLINITKIIEKRLKMVDKIRDHIVLDEPTAAMRPGGKFPSMTHLPRQ